MGGHLQLSGLTPVFTEPDDHYLKYVNLQFVHSTTTTYEQLEVVMVVRRTRGLVYSKFGTEHFALQCFHGDKPKQCVILSLHNQSLEMLRVFVIHDRYTHRVLLFLWSSQFLQAMNATMSCIHCAENWLAHKNSNTLSMTNQEPLYEMYPSVAKPTLTWLPMVPIYPTFVCPIDIGSILGEDSY